MAALTRIKILSTASTTSAPANIYTGELAYSYVTGTQANNKDQTPYLLNILEALLI